MKLSRRDLLKLAAAMSVASVDLPAWAATQPAGQKLENDDYKALVCLFLYGGNDSWNLLFPVSDEQGNGAGGGRGFKTFAERRGELATSHKDLVLPAGNQFDQGNPYGKADEAYRSGFYHLDNLWGMAACAPELAMLHRDRQLALIANTGVLAEPVTRSTINEQNRPYFLYAHNHQQYALASANALIRTRLGWAGRLADNWNPDSKSVLGSVIALDKPFHTTFGATGSGLILPSTGPMAFEDSFAKGDKKLSRFGKAIQTLAASGNSDAFGELVASRYAQSLSISQTLQTWWLPEAPWPKTTASYGEDLFSMPDDGLVGLNGNLDGGLMRQLEATARLIDIGRRTGHKRQLFFISMGGFDTHANQAGRHPVLLRSLSLGLWHFQNAVNAMGISDKVTLFSQSDFGRTLSMNNDGTDHGWSGNQLVMGGAVKSGVYGTMPDLREGSESVMADKRGRVIPSIASEQVTAELLRWMDVPDKDLHLALPLLERFESSRKDRLGIMA
ncbi:DUF1501 domain-containing protein [Oceanobacter mangrovi]|uniref:DUF1501 domain-containing protein n=1 Tax=Oceanobacter mangrovi TaxID=2862510 RepID=UPI001C8D59CD|nr:DUF1501 domain-containing protein [Oceanobacter mangrovi]